MKTKVTLTYFKPSGKYYAEGEYESEKEHIHEIWEEVQQMEIHPGLSGRWQSGSILIMSDHTNAHPHLVILGR
jgi:hypothetical protein